MKRGEIYVVNFNTDNDREIFEGEQFCTRPGIIIQNDVGNKFSPTTIVALLTSKKKKTNQPTHCKIQCKGLEKESYLLAEQIRTVSKDRLGIFIGTCSNMGEVDECLKVSIGLK